MDIELLQKRAAVIKQVRSFFDSRNYLELDTPLLSPDLIPESCLEVFETSRIKGNGERQPCWLVPSPEIWMKKIIARHRTNVYQICKCFRNGESSGYLHSPEFTMLEYYTMNADYKDSLQITEELIQELGKEGGSLPPSSSPPSAVFHLPPSAGALDKRCGFAKANPEGDAPATPPPSPRSLSSFTKITVAEAFSRYAGFDLFETAEKKGGLEAEARRLGLEPPEGLSTGALYDLIFIHAVEPQLKQNKPVALLDYPAFVPCLARKSPDGKTTERWELYHNGVELANCFSEETDAEQVKRFFENESAEKERQSLVHHNVDNNYWKNFLSFPRCSGVAMGLDRLIMTLCGRSTIDSVLPFPME